MASNSSSAQPHASKEEVYSPALSGKQVTQAISALGIRKANTKVWQLLLLGVLAGLYIGVGGHLFLVAMQAGFGRIVAGMVFAVGLVLVVVAGAELFTGNILMVVGALTLRISPGQMLRNWSAVYVGNLLGALLMVALVSAAGLLFRGGAPTDVGAFAATVAAAKLKLTFAEAFYRGILCNMLVILAIIMAILSKDIISKIVCCVLPIMAFVASGYEHCVANMYLIPAGLVVGDITAVQCAALAWSLVAVTLGNIVGGIGILLLHPNRIRQFFALAFGRQV